MKLKSKYTLLILAFLFIFTSNVNLEARHGRHSTRVEVINHTYYTPYQPQYVQYYPQPVYMAQPVVYAPQPVVYAQQPIVYSERVVVRERSCPASLITSFALGLGFGLLR